MGRRLICGRRNAEVPLKYLGKIKQVIVSHTLRNLRKGQVCTG